MARSAFNLGVLGMVAMGDKMAVIGNNIANGRTVAYKSSNTVFGELFVEHQGQLINGIHNQFGNGVQLSGMTTDWSPGAIEDTSNEANVAVEGAGFLTVKYHDIDTSYYTRAGDFAIVAAPSSIDSVGGYVLRRPNGSILCGAHDDTTDYDSTTGIFNVTQKPLYFYAERFSASAWHQWESSMGSVPSPTSFTLSTDGIVTAEPEGPEAGSESVGDYRVRMRIEDDTTSYSQIRVGVQRFNNPDSLERNESGMFKFTDKTSALNVNTAGNPLASAPNSNGGGRTRQGMLEQSNVDLVKEFTEMIITQRAYQANAKTITTADEMLQTVMSLKR